jgi:transcriptional regulator with XRE-family HTH domain
MNTTNFSNVAEAAAALAGSPEMQQRVEREIVESSLVSALMSFRVAKGITQEQVAKVMGCDSSKISRLESGNDRNLKWMDVVNYTEALNVDMCVLFEDPSLPAADRIKHHVFRIHGALESLAALAKQVGGDDEIAKKIHQFYGEVLLNFLTKYKQSHDKLASVVKVTHNPPPQKCLPNTQKESDPELVK